ncbi:hypothetical protein MCHIJ_08620 [Mycolicibacterium chitae]|nr:hypothetical protein MCHIJ_08620 [Mycolicibacterium chitae]
MSRCGGGRNFGLLVTSILLTVPGGCETQPSPRLAQLAADGEFLTVFSAAVGTGPRVYRATHRGTRYVNALRSARMRIKEVGEARGDEFIAGAEDRGVAG